MAQFAYTENALELQKRFDTTALAAAELQAIPRMQRMEGSRYVPDVITGAQAIAGWKRIDAIQGVLPQRDQGKADTVGGLITMDEWGGMVMKGDPLAGRSPAWLKVIRLAEGLRIA